MRRGTLSPLPFSQVHHPRPPDRGWLFSWFNPTPVTLRRPMRRLICIAALALLPALVTSAADLSVSLPLGPYYRPGKYLPVRVGGVVPANARAVVTADTGEGAGRTRVDAV